MIPGLVDTHRHVWQGAIGGFTPQMTGAGYDPAVLRGIAPRHTAEDVYAGTLWGAPQALDAGITTIADWAHNLQSAAHADANLRGLQESGIRGYFLYGGPGPASEDPNPPHPLALPPSSLPTAPHYLAAKGSPPEQVHRMHAAFTKSVMLHVTAWTRAYVDGTSW